jgi:ParB/RepB/Spo0J family partition protein
MATAAPAPATEAKKETVASIALELLHPAEDNVRAEIRDVTELAMSIKSSGIQQPLVVRPRDGARGYEVVFGHRRLAGAALAGLDEVPCIIRDYDEQARVVAMAVENLQREDLTALEEARAYKRLAGLGLTQREISARVGRTQGHISKRIALLQLPEAATAALDSGRITVEEALELTRLREHPERIEKLLKGGGNLHISYWVPQELAMIEQEKKAAAAAAALEKKGVRVLGVVYNRYALPDGAVEVERDPWSVGAVVMDPQKHAARPCHAVVLQSGDLTPLAVCTDPDSHPKSERKQPSSLADGRPTKAQRQAEQAQREFNQAREQRRAFAGELVRGKVSKDDALELALHGILRIELYEGLAIACRLLQLDDAVAAKLGDPDDEPIDDTPADVYVDVDPELLEQVLHEYAARSPIARARATLAAAIGACEESQGLTWISAAWLPDTVDYIRFLERRGYKPAKIEADALKRATERKP